MKYVQMTLLVAAMLAVSSCRSTTAPSADPVPDPVVQSSASEDGLKLVNPTDKTIYYTAFERTWATNGLFIWAACTEPDSCPSVAPGATVKIPYSAIGGYKPGASEAIVYFWELVPGNDGYRTDKIQSLIVSF